MYIQVDLIHLSFSVLVLFVGTDDHYRPVHMFNSGYGMTNKTRDF